MPAKKNANGDGTVYQRIDGRWCGAGYVLVADGTRRRMLGLRQQPPRGLREAATPDSPTRPGAPPWSQRREPDRREVSDHLAGQRRQTPPAGDHVRHL